jgi:lipopolysaccharide biosynthesis glycosyltransferase
LGILVAVLSNDLYYEEMIKDKPTIKADNQKEDKQKNENKNHNSQNIEQKDKNIKKSDFILDDDDDLEDEKTESVNHIIHIALNIDNKFIYPCIVFLTSVLDNRKPSTIYHIHILTSKDFRENNINKINTLINKFGKDFLKINFINMQNAFEGAMTNNYISTSSYYRIRLPSLLSDIDRVLYIDTDVINFADLTEMYNLELNDDIYLLGALDNAENISELRLFGIYTNKYINAGVLLMNLKSMRKFGIENKLTNFVNNYFLEHHDQTAINAVCYNNFGILSIKYATFCFDYYESLVRYNNRQDKRYRYSEAELKQAYYEPVLLHYVGWTKPWDRGNNIKYSEYWWYYAKQTDFYDEIVLHYGFNKINVEAILKKIPKNGGLLKRKFMK